MIEKLKPLLEYQKVDIELRRELDEIERHELNKKREAARQEFDDAKNSVAQTEKAAERIIAFFESAQKSYEENLRKFEELEKRLASLKEEDEQERKDILAQISAIRDQAVELEKQFADQKAKSSDVIHTYVEAHKKGSKMREIFGALSKKLNEFKEEKMPKITELKTALSKMEKGIDEEIFKTYKSITAERKYPAVVEGRTYDGGKNFTCSGCGLAISQKVKDELLEKNVCRCDNCHRIIYKN